MIDLPVAVFEPVLRVLAARALVQVHDAELFSSGHLSVVAVELPLPTCGGLTRPAHGHLSIENSKAGAIATDAVAVVEGSFAFASCAFHVVHFLRESATSAPTESPRPLAQGARSLSC